MTFQNFIEKFGPNGSDDNGPDMMALWLGNLSYEEILEYAEMAHNDGVPVESIFKINF